MINILAIPIGVETTASTRIRLYALGKSLGRKFNFVVVKPENITGTLLEGIDILYVQKIATLPVIRFCKIAKKKGIPIIYDIDDEFGCWPEMDELTLCKYATAITVDTDDRKLIIQKITKSKVFTVKCMIDLYDDPIRQKSKKLRREIKRIGSFGNYESLKYAKPYLESVPSNQFDKIIIGPPTFKSYIKDTTLIEFDIKNFLEDLQSLDLIILAHSETDEGKRKDNNRLITAMSLGIPTITSNTKAYRETLIDLGQPEWICKNPDNFFTKIMGFQELSSREIIKNSFQSYAEKNYAPKVIGQEFEEAISYVSYTGNTIL